MKEVGPYHWRRHRNRLVLFNRTFIDLPQREVDGAPKHLGPEFRYITQSMEHLAIPPNPRQRAERGLRPIDAAPVLTDAPGEARLVVGLPKDLPLGVGKLHVAVLRADAPAGAPILAHGEDLANHVTLQH